MHRTLLFIKCTYKLKRQFLKELLESNVRLNYQKLINSHYLSSELVNPVYNANKCKLITIYIAMCILEQ